MSLPFHWCREKTSCSLFVPLIPSSLGIRFYTDKYIPLSLPALFEQRDREEKYTLTVIGILSLATFCVTLEAKIDICNEEGPASSFISSSSVVIRIFVCCCRSYCYCWSRHRTCLFSFTLTHSWLMPDTVIPSMSLWSLGWASSFFLHLYFYLSKFWSLKVLSLSSFPSWLLLCHTFSPEDASMADFSSDILFVGMMSFGSHPSFLLLLLTDFYFFLELLWKNFFTSFSSLCSVSFPLVFLSHEFSHLMMSWFPFILFSILFRPAPVSFKGRPSFMM